jgi:hypothetical protein
VWNHRRDRSTRREPSERDTSTIAMSLGSHGGRSGNDPQHAETSINSHLFQATIEARIDDLRRDAAGRQIAANAAGLHRATAGRMSSIRYRFRPRSLRASVA